MCYLLRRAPTTPQVGHPLTFAYRESGVVEPHDGLRAQPRLAASLQRCLHLPAGVTFLSKQEQQGNFQADRVIFINDVFFCVNDVMRLAFQDADLACGMDFQQQFPGLLAFYDTW